MVIVQTSLSFGYYIYQFRQMNRRLLKFFAILVIGNSAWIAGRIDEYLTAIEIVGPRGIVAAHPPAR